MKLRLAIVFILLLSICAQASGMSSTQKEQKYVSAVAALETYLQGTEESVVTLSAIKREFDSLENYSKSATFAYYVNVLLNVAQNDFGFMTTHYLNMLEKDAEFDRYIEDNLTDSSIQNVARLKSYAEARKYEYNGDIVAAAEFYKDAIPFFDSMKRCDRILIEQYESLYLEAMKRLNNGDYVGAYMLLEQTQGYKDSSELMYSIVLYLGYTPLSEDDKLGSVQNLSVTNVTQTSVTLAWSAANHAEQYCVEYKPSGSSLWQVSCYVVGTSATVNGLYVNNWYDFRVTALGGDIKTRSAEIYSVLTASPTPSPTAVTPTPTPIPKNAYRTGQSVTFGRYEQDGNISNGKEAIVWTVLDSDSNGNYLLISKYALDWQRYNEQNVVCTWEDSTLRIWLNSEFYFDAFNSSERAAIVSKNVYNSSNSVYGTRGGSATNDDVFLLSIDEVLKYFSVSKNTSEKYYWRGESRLVKNPTEYAINHGAEMTNGAVYWWLRSPGETADHAARINANGNVIVSGNRVHAKNGVVPVIWVKLS